MPRFLPRMIPLTETPTEDQEKPTLFGRLTLTWGEYFRFLERDVSALEVDAILYSLNIR